MRVARATLALCIAVGTAGCDPPELPEPKVEAKAATPAAEPAGQLAPDPGADVDACLAACARGETLSATDRETCRLQCDPTTTRAFEDSTPANTALAKYDACQRSCGAQAPGGDRATCRLQCAQGTAAEVAPPNDTRRDCYAGCLESLAGCEVACPAAEGDDRATCEARCEQDVTRCLQPCGRAGGS